MNHPNASRSGRPHGAAGPLASLVVGMLAAVGLGCAAVGVAPSSAVGVGPTAGPSVTDGTPRLDAASRLEAIELRRTARSATTPSEPPAVVEPDPEPLPDIPVVDAAPKPPPNTKPAQPARLTIADVDIDVEVRPTGIAEDGSMELPETVRRAGWYEFGATPRDRVGTTVIAAHVDTKTEGLGPFSRLATLRRGERIVVTDRGGKEHTYRVLSRRLVVATKLPVDDLFDRDGSPRLVLLTCGGAYDARSGYRDNVVVTAEPDR
jgi:sortase family protein